MTATATEYIARDRWGRPLINPPDGGDPVPYTRVSTLAKAIDKGEALTRWKLRMTAVGLARRPDLLTLVQASREDDRSTLDDACEQALAAAKSQAAANTGTALHTLTERMDGGENLDEMVVAEPIRADLRAYQQRMAGVKVVSAETFVVVDEIRAAGTFDRLVEIDGHTYIADIKTGQHEPKYPHAATIQCAIYSRGVGYLPNGRRTIRLGDYGVNQDRAVLIHLPAGKAQCDLYWLDIAAGWEMALTATRVREWHSSKPLQPFKE